MCNVVSESTRIKSLKLCTPHRRWALVPWDQRRNGEEPEMCDQQAELTIVWPSSHRRQRVWRQFGIFWLQSSEVCGECRRDSRRGSATDVASCIPLHSHWPATAVSCLLLNAEHFLSFMKNGHRFPRLSGIGMWREPLTKVERPFRSRNFMHHLHRYCLL